MKPVQGMSWRRQWLLFLACLCLWPAAAVRAATSDWGVIPVDTTTTISFAQTDITSNFTDSYYFSLASGAALPTDEAVVGCYMASSYRTSACPRPLPRGSRTAGDGFLRTIDVYG